MLEISHLDWALAILAAMLVGIAKSGIPGAGILIVPLMANIFANNTKASVGILLPMLIVGDTFGVIYYKRHADWDKLKRLFPWVVPGLFGGAIFLHTLGDRNDVMKPLLGGIVLAMLVLDLIRRKMKWESMPHTTWFTGGTGSLAGFSTTVGNAAGSVMNLYFLSLDMPKERFVGTAAWFFMIVNWTKVPIFAGLGMISADSLLFDASLIPAIALGAYLGMKLLPKVPQHIFNRIILVLTAIAALKLLF